MRLLIVSHKRHCQSPDGQVGVDGGFPTLTSEFARYAKVVTLCVPVTEEDSLPCTVDYPPNLMLCPLPDFDGRLGFIIRLPRIIRALWRECGRADLVYPMGPNDLGLLGLLISRLRRKPVFVSFDTDREANLAVNPRTAVNGIKRFGIRYVIYPLIRLAAGSVPAYFTGDVYLGARPTWRTWIKTTVRAGDLPSLKEAPAFLEPLRLVFAGRLVSLKNIDCLIDAARILVDGGTRVEVIIIGDGPEYGRLQARCLDERLTFITFSGRVENHEIKRTRFMNADVVVLPSKAERQGKVLLEAMACSVPVVASRVGGIPYTIRHDQNGLLFDPESATDLACTILRLKNSKELRSTLVRNGYDFSMANSLDAGIKKVMREVFEFYNLPVDCHWAGDGTRTLTQGGGNDRA